MHNRTASREVMRHRFGKAKFDVPAIKHTGGAGRFNLGCRVGPLMMFSGWACTIAGGNRRNRQGVRKITVLAAAVMRLLVAVGNMA